MPHKKKSSIKGSNPKRIFILVATLFALLAIISTYFASQKLTEYRSYAAETALDCTLEKNINSKKCTHGGDKFSPELLKRYKGEDKSYLQKTNEDTSIPESQKVKIRDRIQKERTGRGATDTDTIGVAAPETGSCAGQAGTGGARVQILFLHKQNEPSLTTERAAYLREIAAGVDAIFIDSAAKTGGRVRVRWSRDPDCQISVREIIVGNATSLRSFQDVTRKLKAKGYKSDDRKYVVFLEHNFNDGTCGYGTLQSGQPYTDVNNQYNPNNTKTGYAVIEYGIQRNCWNRDVVAHEIVHVLGGVQNSAPHSTQAGHCTDGLDVECYRDSGLLGDQYTSTSCAGDIRVHQLDCNNNDYFHTSPQGHNTYLSTHWNIADSRFLIR